MAKDRNVDHASSDQDTAHSPYACCLKAFNCKNHDCSLFHVGGENEWEVAQCPVCLEHPHNAVLLLCSSKDKGCRPFICDTSYRHSNCFDQFKKSFAQASGLQTGNEDQKPELICPLCRGLITGWIVVEPAREYMDSKIRSCSLETCNFSGNYARLRKHARTEHPSKRPSEVSPTRQSSWLNMEQQRELEDAYAYHSDFGIDSDGFPDPDVFPEFDPDWEWLDFENWDEFLNRSFDVVDDILHSPSPSYRTTSSLDTFDWSSFSSSEMSFRISPFNDARRDDAIQSSRSRRNYHDRVSHSRLRSGYARENDEANLSSRSRINHDRENSRFNIQRESSSSRRWRRRLNPTNQGPRSDYYRENQASSSRPIRHREESRRSDPRSSYHRDNARSFRRSRIRPRSRSRENGSSSRVVSSSRAREVAPERSRRRRSRDRSSSRYNNR